MSRTVLEHALLHIAQKKGVAHAPVVDARHDRADVPNDACRPSDWELAVQALKELIRAELPRIVRAELESFRSSLVRQLAEEGLATEAVSRCVRATIDALGSSATAALPTTTQGAPVMAPKPKPVKQEREGYNPAEGADALLAIVESTGALPAVPTQPVASSAGRTSVPLSTPPVAVARESKRAPCVSATPLPVTPDAVYAGPSVREGATPNASTPATVEQALPVVDVAAPLTTASAETMGVAASECDDVPPASQLTHAAVSAPNPEGSASLVDQALTQTSSNAREADLIEAPLPDAFGALQAEGSDEAAIDDIPERDIEYTEVSLSPEPVDDVSPGGSAASEATACGGDPMPPAEKARVDAFVAEACEEFRAVSRSIQAEMKVLPIKISKLIAEQLTQSSHQKHLEAINVSLSSLNDAIGSLSGQDMTASVKRAHAELWPGFNLPAEIADIKNRLAGLEAATVSRDA